jgi:hypothetical protein
MGGDSEREPISHRDGEGHHRNAEESGVRRREGRRPALSPSSSTLSFEDIVLWSCRIGRGLRARPSD